MYWFNVIDKWLQTNKKLYDSRLCQGLTVRPEEVSQQQKTEFQLEKKRFWNALCRQGRSQATTPSETQTEATQRLGPISQSALSEVHKLRSPRSSHCNSPNKKAHLKKAYLFNQNHKIQLKWKYDVQKATNKCIFKSGEPYTLINPQPDHRTSAVHVSTSITFGSLPSVWALLNETYWASRTASKHSRGSRRSQLVTEEAGRVRTRLHLKARILCVDFS